MHDYALYKDFDVGREGNDDAEGLMIDEYDELVPFTAIYIIDKATANSEPILRGPCFLSTIFTDFLVQVSSMPPSKSYNSVNNKSITVIISIIPQIYPSSHLTNTV